MKTGYRSYRTTTFNHRWEIERYFNKNTNTYEFVRVCERGVVVVMDVEFNFNLDVLSNIYACNINAKNIKVRNIKARHIHANHIYSWDIEAENIYAKNMVVGNVQANNITALNISYNKVCFAEDSIVCCSIKSRKKYSKHFVFKGTITLIKLPEEKITIELTEEQLVKIKEVLEEEK